MHGKNGTLEDLLLEKSQIRQSKLDTDIVQRRSLLKERDPLWVSKIIAGIENVYLLLDEL
ncbi:MAG TPA: hypothetical protein PLA90_02590 [Candidatus Sumerlaeota bacterium]|nr:hypothetical protein [Candidatus Sumerlaeota bacterium]